MNEILIIIPAYNEEKNIEKVASMLQPLSNICDFLVVNDGSKDNTELITKEISYFKLVNLRINLGIGGAVQTGFKFAKNNNYQYAIQFDGDGQHNPNEILALLEPIKNSETDVVIGSRFINKEGFQSTFLRRFGISIFKFLNSILINQTISDNTSGFRAYNRKSIEFLSDNYPQDFPEPETVILLGKNGFKIKEIPVIMNHRHGGESSIKGFKSAYYMVKVILSILISSLRKRII